MNWVIGLQVGFREIWDHKFRSFLTMLGIILGVSSLLAMFGLTAGIAQGWRNTMQQLGGLERVGVISKEAPQSQKDLVALSPGRTLRDAIAIRDGASLVSHVSPEMQITGAVESDAGGVYRGQITGIWPEMYVVNQHEIERGRFITPLDVERGLRSVVIGQGVRRELWPDDPQLDPVGRVIRINQIPYTVVGLLTLYEREEEKRRRALRGGAPAPTSGRGGGGPRRDPFVWKNNAVLIPLSTMFHEFKSGLFPQDSMDSVRLDFLAFRVADVSRFDEAVQQVTNILNTTHRGIDDYGFETREDWFDRMESSLRATRLSGGIIAGISLLVGGIGITNIMLASVAERIREIGVRLAVGARQRDIFFQILVESGVIGLIGGLLGLAAGAGLMRVLIWIAPAENAPVMEWSAVAISCGFAVAVGIFSGIYPAWKASRLDPMSALRYE